MNREREMMYNAYHKRMDAARLNYLALRELYGKDIRDDTMLIKARAEKVITKEEYSDLREYLAT